jgi:hypothetical protein
MGTDKVFFYGFSCTWCKYKCIRNNDMQKHMMTRKHKKNVDVLTPVPGLVPEPESDTTSMQQPVMGVVKTRIDNGVVVEEKCKDKDTLFGENDCICGKSYKHPSSLCKHRKKCDVYLTSLPTLSSLSTLSTSSVPEPCIPSTSDMSEPHVSATEPDVNAGGVRGLPANAEGGMRGLPAEGGVRGLPANAEGGVRGLPAARDPFLTEFLTNIITEQSKRNEELKDILVEQTRQLVVLSEKSRVTNNITTTNNTVNNNKFNMNLFLNTECKDAMNIMEFIDSLPVETHDLENMGSFGFVDGITRILLNGLRDLDVYRRPIHCSDAKRDSIYIKDNDAWEKDTDKCDKMKKVIRYVRHKNVKRIPQWQKENPTFSNPRTKTHARYMNIIGNAMGGATDEEDEQLHNKVIRRVVPEINIPKHSRNKMVYGM